MISLERVELEGSVDFYRAAPPELDRALGLGLDALASDEEIDRVVELFAALGVRYYVRSS